MATSVKIDDPDKQDLDRLQAEYVVRTGRRISQQELLAILIRRGRRELDAIVDAYPKWTPAERRRVMSLPVKTGIRTREEDIDRTLYGAEA